MALSLITDRTQEDVDRVLALAGAGYGAWSSDDISAWNGAAMKGAYNVSDIIRVIGAMQTLADYLNSAGFNISLQTMASAASLVTNGNFSNGTTGWTSDRCSLSVSDNILSATWTTTSSFPYFQQTAAASQGITAGHIYYVHCRVLSPKDTDVFRFVLANASAYNNIGGNHKLRAGAWETISAYGAAATDIASNKSDLMIRFGDTTDFASGDTFYIRDIVAVDMSALGWVENAERPTEALMNAYYQDLCTIRDALPLLEDTPDLPESMDHLTFGGANAIEQMLLNVESMINLYNLTMFPPSGYAMCGGGYT